MKSWLYKYYSRWWELWRGLELSIA
jgi:hypothetical protein